jgi:hypothetical protein
MIWRRPDAMVCRRKKRVGHESTHLRYFSMFFYSAVRFFSAFSLLNFLGPNNFGTESSSCLPPNLRKSDGLASFGCGPLRRWVTRRRRSLLHNVSSFCGEMNARRRYGLASVIIFSNVDSFLMMDVFRVHFADLPYQAVTFFQKDA